MQRLIRLDEAIVVKDEAAHSWPSGLGWVKDQGRLQ